MSNQSVKADACFKVPNLGDSGEGSWFVVKYGSSVSAHKWSTYASSFSFECAGLKRSHFGKVLTKTTWLGLRKDNIIYCNCVLSSHLPNIKSTLTFGHTWDSNPGLTGEKFCAWPIQQARPPPDLFFSPLLFYTRKGSPQMTPQG